MVCSRNRRIPLVLKRVLHQSTFPSVDFSVSKKRSFDETPKREAKHPSFLALFVL